MHAGDMATADEIAGAAVEALKLKRNPNQEVCISIAEWRSRKELVGLLLEREGYDTQQRVSLSAAQLPSQCRDYPVHHVASRFELNVYRNGILRETMLREQTSRAKYLRMKQSMPNFCVSLSWAL
jgi:hypothetical protein